MRIDMLSFCIFNSSLPDASCHLLSGLQRSVIYLKNGFHLFYQLQRVERLGNVVGAEVMANASIDILGVGSHNDHRDMPGEGISAQAIEEPIAVLARHHHVEENQVGRMVVQQTLQLRSTVSGSYLKAIERQGNRHNLADLFIIVNHNNVLHFTPLPASYRHLDDTPRNHESQESVQGLFVARVATRDDS